MLLLESDPSLSEPVYANHGMVIPSIATPLTTSLTSQTPAPTVTTTTTTAMPTSQEPVPDSLLLPVRNLIILNTPPSPTTNPQIRIPNLVPSPMTLGCQLTIPSPIPGNLEWLYNTLPGFYLTFWLLFSLVRHVSSRNTRTTAMPIQFRRFSFSLL